MGHGDIHGNINGFSQFPTVTMARLGLRPVAIGLLQRSPLPASTMASLQRVLHAAARLVLDLRSSRPCDTNSERAALAADLPEN